MHCVVYIRVGAQPLHRGRADRYSSSLNSARVPVFSLHPTHQHPSFRYKPSSRNTLAMADATTAARPPPVKYAVALFPGFQLLDVAGPLDVLAVLAQQVPVEVYVLAATLAPVTSRTARPGSVGQEIVPTHTFATAPDDIEVLLIPGGGGTRDVAGTQPLVDYAARVYPKLRYFMTVCTGAALAVRAGLLDGKKATTNKLAFDWVRFIIVAGVVVTSGLTRCSCTGGGARPQGQLDTPRALGERRQYLDVVGHLGRHRHDVWLRGRAVRRGRGRHRRPQARVYPQHGSDQRPICATRIGRVKRDETNSFLILTRIYTTYTHLYIYTYSYIHPAFLQLKLPVFLC